MYIVILIFILGILIRHLNKPMKPAILSIYQQKNPFYCTKYVFMLSILKLRQVLFNIRNKKLDSLKLKNYDLDRPQTLHNHPLAIDAVYFNASSKNGAALICGVARRPNQICNAFLYLRTEGGQLLLSPELPDTTLKQDTIEENYHVAGIKIDMVEPMKTWKIKYEGPMKFYNDPSKTVVVKLDASFESDRKHFNYDTDMSASGTAMVMAREMWSREYFNTLERVHQTHYEQHGQINGKVIIDGDEHNLSVECVRDHTFGKYREWKNFHRYGLHFINLANGDYITVGKICMPICFSNLTVGFIHKKNSKKNFPISFCDLELYQHGENLIPPKDYAFQFHAGGTQYTIQVDVIDSPTFYIGNERECRVVERLAKFLVNGVEGWGAAEWQYRNIGQKNNM